MRQAVLAATKIGSMILQRQRAKDRTTVPSLYQHGAAPRGVVARQLKGLGSARPTAQPNQDTDDILVRD
jgi:hypothetical protein